MEAKLVCGGKTKGELLEEFCADLVRRECLLIDDDMDLGFDVAVEIDVRDRALLSSSCCGWCCCSAGAFSAVDWFAA